MEELWITEPETAFDPKRCLFCRFDSANFEENLEHMHGKHGLFIPYVSQLLVDPETLIEYLHLVIFGYFECLYCRSKRSSPVAAQQHMLGKRHCKIDLTAEDSEYREFFDFDGDVNDDNNQILGNLQSPSGLQGPFDEGKFVRLSSRKLLSHRTQGKSRSRRRETSKDISSRLLGESATKVSQSVPASSDQDLSLPPDSKRIIKRNAAFLQHLSTLRSNDQRSLMHLPLWKQRTVVLKSKKQVEQARRDENDMLLKIQLKANR
jgi:pre-60S factor REI1